MIQNDMLFIICYYLNIRYLSAVISNAFLTTLENSGIQTQVMFKCFGMRYYLKCVIGLMCYRLNVRKFAAAL